MQFTLFASIAFLCSSALAAPPQLRDGLVDVDADVNNVANNLTVKVLSEREVDLSKRVDLNIRDDLVGVSADVNDIANNLTVKVLSERNERDSSKRSSNTLVGVDVGKYRSYEIMAIIDTGSTGVDDILNNATVKVISE